MTLVNRLLENQKDLVDMQQAQLMYVWNVCLWVVKKN